MISIRNLTRCYGSVVAVRDVSADIQRGEVVGLLGHNGAGKTTVMKMMTGFLEPTSGTIRIDDLDVVVDRTAVQRRLGYLPENAPIYTEMLVQDYLLMMAELRGVPAQARRNAVLEAVQRTGLEQQVVTPIAQLSKGYRQRVGIAQALVHKPDVLVLDEPTNGLDPMQIEAIRDLIRQLGEAATVILSTHILQEVEAVCDRALIMIGGRLAADATLAELTSTDAIELVLARGAGDVRRTLLDLPGVGTVEPADVAEEGPQRWTIRCTGEASPAEIVQVAVGKGWQVLAVRRAERRLEDVFKRLHADHVAQARGGAA